MRRASLPLLDQPGPAEPYVSARQRADWPVLLVSMPFMSVDRPSIQLGLLKAVTAAHGFPVRTVHAGLDFAVQIGVDYYRLLCQRRSRMIGDWLFAADAFGPDDPDPDCQLVDDFADELAYLGGTARQRRERLLRIRRRDVPAYLDELILSMPWQQARVVGFTSTFQQNAASFALARRLKQRHPGIVTVFGGANFDGEMGGEYVRTVEVIDYAVIGEGDEAFPRLLRSLAAGTPAKAVPGVARRVGGSVVATRAEPPLHGLDGLPVPDYDEYFDRAESLGLQPRDAHRQIALPFESARGCWWGAKHHCTFCGLNGATMRFRAKSAQRVADELALQARRYRTFRFEAVDNILDMRYLTGLLPDLIASGTTYDLFYEVKANLSKAQLELLRRAGVTAIQPGLESLSTHVLKLMRKGVTAAQNINVLRWGRHYGISVSWNVLWGFPGETEADYRDQAALVPHLVHLPPPAGAGRVWLERFSPLYDDAPGDAGARRPEGSYRYVYPAGVDLEKVAYFFEYDLIGRLPEHVYAPLRTAVDDWISAWQGGKPPVLTYWSAPGFLQIYDGRHPGAEGTFTFHDDLARIYLACAERPVSAAAVSARLGGDVSPEAVREAFLRFADRGLMFLDGARALALALPAQYR